MHARHYVLLHVWFGELWVICESWGTKCGLRIRDMMQQTESIQMTSRLAAVAACLESLVQGVTKGWMSKRVEAVAVAARRRDLVL